MSPSATAQARPRLAPARFVLRVARDFSTHRIAVRAAALSYTSLLALVPLLAVVLAVSKTLLRNQDPAALSRAVDRFLAYAVPQLQALSSDDMASARQDVLARINEAVGRIDAGALGVFGAVTLISVGISLLSAVEMAFNDLWGVPRGRPLARRVLYYWAGVTLGPIVPMLSVAVMSSAAVNRTLGWLPGWPMRTFWFLLPFVLLTASFTLLYRTLPNTEVPVRSALLGGFVAGLLLQLNNLGSALYFSQVASYSRVYGSLGAIPVVMVGLYFSWIIVLLGAEVAHAAATPEAPPGTPRDQLPRVLLAVSAETAADLSRALGGADEEGIRPPSGDRTTP